MRSKIVGIACGCVSLVAISLFVLPLPDGKGDTTREPPIEPTISALHSPNQKTLDALPEEAQASFTMMMEMDGTTDVAPSLISEISGPAGHHYIFMQVSDRICMLDKRDFTGTCGPEKEARAGRMFSAHPIGCNAYELTGIMPDGVTELSVDANADGSKDSAIPVTSNVYNAKLSPVRTVLSNADGTIRVNVPLDWYASDNAGCESE